MASRNFLLVLFIKSSSSPKRASCSCACVSKRAKSFISTGLAQFSETSRKRSTHLRALAALTGKICSRLARGKNAVTRVSRCSRQCSLSVVEIIDVNSPAVKFVCLRTWYLARRSASFGLATITWTDLSGTLILPTFSSRPVSNMGTTMFAASCWSPPYIFCHSAYFTCDLPSLLCCCSSRKASSHERPAWRGPASSLHSLCSPSTSARGSSSHVNLLPKNVNAWSLRLGTRSLIL
mmetsp:Transcript_9262/g.18240  ORF Transcript_9262/g.18240 Transcript_9262/m.18240 type:complete len:236 (-) Transcript_9262:223-930(-)